ncbi:hypothetical protein R5R35_005607 [Gryllus longicercus]|uniref:Uncharacterized protein n=1 Tax=Gryllus longicercus TaxID=2509291 RepID=A0AAN9VMK8_9ORTH
MGDKVMIVFKLDFQDLSLLNTHSFLCEAHQFICLFIYLQIYFSSFFGNLLVYHVCLVIFLPQHHDFALNSCRRSPEREHSCLQPEERFRRTPTPNNAAEPAHYSGFSPNHTASPPRSRIFSVSFLFVPVPFTLKVFTFQALGDRLGPRTQRIDRYFK